MPTFDKMMSETVLPIFARWETSGRFYQAWLGQDLLGDWTVLQQWGGKHTGLGSQLVVCVEAEVEGVQQLKLVAKQRERRGYQLRELRKGEIKAL